MSTRRLLAVVVGVLLGAASYRLLEHPRVHDALWSGELDLFRAGACRDAGLETPLAPARLLWLGSSRSWAATQTQTPLHPVCGQASFARGTRAPERLPDEPTSTPPAAQETLMLAMVGLRDMSVLSQDMDLLKPETLIIELELLATRRLRPSLATRRQWWVSRARWALEDLLLPSAQPLMRHYPLDTCVECFSDAFAAARSEELRRNLSETVGLRPYVKTLLKARAAAGKSTVIVDLPRAPALEAAMRKLLDPWRAYFSALAASDPYLHVRRLELELSQADFYNEAHLNTHGRAKVAPWVDLLVWGGSPRGDNTTPGGLPP